MVGSRKALSTGLEEEMSLRARIGSTQEVPRQEGVCMSGSGAETYIIEFNLGMACLLCRNLQLQ
jgi:hypothetical protein